MKTIVTLLMAVALLVAVNSCTPSPKEVDMQLQEAVAALEGGQPQQARSLAGKLMADTARMDAHQLATLGYVFLRLSEVADNPIDAPQALMCYHAAVTKSPADAGSLIASDLPGAGRIEDILNKLDGNLRNPATLDDEPDSLGMEFAVTEPQP